MNPVATNPAFVSLTTAARRLGVPATWLRDEAQQGLVPSIRCGRSLRFNVEAVADALRQRAANEKAASHA